MARVLNTAFVNGTIGSHHHGGKDRDDTRGELGNPACPFATPDDAYRAWVDKEQNVGKSCCNQLLTIEIAPGCFLRLKNFLM